MKPQPEAPALAWARGRRGNPGAGGAPAARVRSSAAESQEAGPATAGSRLVRFGIWDVGSLPIISYEPQLRCLICLMHTCMCDLHCNNERFSFS